MILYGKVLCVIDHFGSGGAQRQMVELACGLQRRGHQVQAFLYYPDQTFFRHRLDESGIIVHAMSKGRGFSLNVLASLRRLIDSERFDAVVSFLDRPNVYAELAWWWSSVRPRLVVSERSHHRHDATTPGARLRRQLHRCAHAVVANSRTHAQWLEAQPALAGHAHCIYNGLDLSRFGSAPNVPKRARDLQLLAIGRIGAEKNALTLVQALALHHDRHGWVPQLDWVGRRDESPSGQRYWQQLEAALHACQPVADRWRWLGERDDVPALLASHHALVHASFYEGLPNVVCEALASARPVIASAVCDHPLLVQPPSRGRLFDPADAGSLLAALESLHGLDEATWTAMGRAARAFAAEALAADRMVREYESLMGLGNGRVEP